MNQIHDYLRYKGYMIWRINVGAARYERNGRSSFVRFGVPGMADLIGIMPKSGRFVAIEVKRPSAIKKVTRWQQEFLDQVNDAGGLGLVATCVEDLEGKV